VPILCFDGDSAGQKAALRAATRALPMLAPGRSLAFVTLPQGQDPDDLVKAGGAPAMEALLKTPEPLVERLWQSERDAEPLDTPEQRAGLKRRLGDLAATIADGGVRSEYQAEFRRRCDAHFTPQRKPFLPMQRGKQPWRPGGPSTASLPVTADAKAVRAAGMDPILCKAVLAGLIRHPAEIARHMEVLGSLKLADGALGRLFEAVVDVALEDQRDGMLDSGRLVTILGKSGFEAIASDLLRADAMPYTFTQKSANAARAREDLEEAIAILIARPEVDAMLAQATSAMQARFTDEAFERQVAMVREKQALDERLANLVQSNEDARSLGSEGN
jgi:DNA primase